MDVKERIVKEAGKLFLENGIKNVSMDYLATSMGISKRTIYENFRDKEEILNTFILQAKEEREKKLSQIIDKSDNIAEIFIRIIEFHRNKQLFSVKFFEDIYKYYPDIYERIKKENGKSINQAKKLLQKGIREEYIRKDLNVDVTAFLMEESTNIYIRASYLEKPPFSFQELFFTMMISFIRGISTEKGIKIIDDYLAKNACEK
jgi:AcrR family transcriptional regulator